MAFREAISVVVKESCIETVLLQAWASKLAIETNPFASPREMNVLRANPHSAATNLFPCLFASRVAFATMINRCSSLFSLLQGFQAVSTLHESIAARFVVSFLSFELSEISGCSERGGTGRSNVDVNVPLPRFHHRAVADPQLIVAANNSVVLLMLICPSSILPGTP